MHRRRIRWRILIASSFCAVAALGSWQMLLMFTRVKRWPEASLVVVAAVVPNLIRRQQMLREPTLVVAASFGIFGWMAIRAVVTKNLALPMVLCFVSVIGFFANEAVSIVDDIFSELLGPPRSRSKPTSLQKCRQSDEVNFGCGFALALVVISVLMSLIPWRL